MTDKEIKNAITKLRIDEHYYGAFGNQFLSNSDIGTLLTNPAKFGQKEEDSKAMAEGRYFHQLILEPKKAVETLFVNCSNRNTNIYKEAIASSGEELLLLHSEGEAIRWLASKMTSNIVFYDEIYKDGNKYEEPKVGLIQGLWFKGKADIETDDTIIDLKTTSDILEFRRSARKYGYDSQCYIYQCLFGKPLVFYVIDKSTGQVGIFRPSEEFIARGESKVARAIEVYSRYYGENHPDDIINYYIDEVLD